MNHKYLNDPDLTNMGIWILENTNITSSWLLYVENKIFIESCY